VELDTGHALSQSALLGIPLLITGELSRSFTGDEFNDQSASSDPFVIVPGITLTATAPGQLSFVAANGPYPAVNADGTTTFSLTGFSYSFHDAQGNLQSLALPPGPNGVYFTITIVPEPAGLALCAVALLALALRS
jgi:hypothetical protein